MKFNLYSVWMDPYFYLLAAVFAAALFFLVYSISKYLEIANSSDFEEGSEEQSADVQGELPLAEAAAAQAPAEDPVPDEEKTLVLPPAPAAEEAPAPVQPVPVPETPHDVSKAEEFVKGLYQNMSSLDNRMKNIEAALAKAKVNRDFTVTFLEDILADYDALSKEKLKARIDYLLSDLKK